MLTDDDKAFVDSFRNHDWSNQPPDVKDVHEFVAIIDRLARELEVARAEDRSKAFALVENELRALGADISVTWGEWVWRLDPVRYGGYDFQVTAKSLIEAADKLKGE